MREERALLGFNAVLGALEAPGRTLDRIFVVRGKSGGRFRQLRQAARKAGVPLVEVDRSRVDRLAGGLPHQGVAAMAAASAYATVESILDACRPEGRLLILDGVEDPRNLGAVIRSAAPTAASRPAPSVPRRGPWARCRWRDAGMWRISFWK